MSRPREFDLDQALDAALAAFWERGYEATSMADLMAAMGLQKGSLYKAFKDKHSLFIAALSRYVDQGFEHVQGLCAQAATPREGVEKWLGMHFGLCVAGEGAKRRGCFAINSAVELAPHDPEVRKVLGAHFKRMEALLAEVIACGQKSGEFRDDVPASELAEFASTSTSGLLASARASMPAERAARMRTLILETLSPRATG